MRLHDYDSLYDNDSENSSDSDENLRRYEDTMLQRVESMTKATLYVREYGNLHLGNYERLRIDEGFDILNLSTLTTLHLGIAAMEYFTTEPNWTKSIFRDKQWSYLSYLPSRYGDVPCLTHAADCVVARLRGMVSSLYPSEDMALSLYVKA